MVTAGVRFVKPFPGLIARQIVSVSFYKNPLQCPYKPSRVTFENIHQRHNVMSMHNFTQ